MIRQKPRHVIARDLPQAPEIDVQNGVWLLPSRNRLERAEACINACYAAGQDSPGLLIQDGCHYSFARPVRQLSKTLFPGMPRKWSAVQTEEHRELAGALTLGWKLNPGKDWYGVISDGVRPKTQGWDRLLIAASGGRNFVSCSDNGWRADTRMAGILLVPGWIIETMGYWFPPGIDHLWSDDAWEHLAGELGNWVYAEDVVVEDNHHGHTDPAHQVPFDHPRIFQGKDLNKTDREAFLAWRNGPEFGACVERIKAKWFEMIGREWDEDAAA